MRRRKVIETNLLVDAVCTRQNPVLVYQHATTPVPDEPQRWMQQLERRLPPKLSFSRRKAVHNFRMPGCRKRRGRQVLFSISGFDCRRS